MPPRQSSVKKGTSGGKKGGKVKKEAGEAATAKVPKESVASGRQGDQEDIDRAAEVSKYPVLRFIGPGEIYGVVNLDEDPNERYSPRPLDHNHVNELAKLFAKGSDTGQVPPIRLVLNEEAIASA